MEKLQQMNLAKGDQDLMNRTQLLLLRLSKRAEDAAFAVDEEQLTDRLELSELFFEFSKILRFVAAENESRAHWLYKNIEQYGLDAQKSPVGNLTSEGASDAN